MSKRLIIFVSLFIATLIPIGVFAATSYQLGNTVTQPINEQGVCAKIVNNSGKSLFVPTGSAGEWTAFRNAIQAGTVSGVTNTYSATSYTQCSAGNRYYFDSCSVQKAVAQTCSCGCTGDTCNSCCTSHSYTYCPVDAGSVYWYDSCNNQQEVSDSCPAGGAWCSGNDQYDLIGGCIGGGYGGCRTSFKWTCPAAGSGIYLCDASNQLNPYQGCTQGAGCTYGGVTSCPTSGTFCGGDGNVYTYSGCPAWTQVTGCSSYQSQTCSNGCSNGSCNAPAQTCGNGVTEGTEVCDGDFQYLGAGPCGTAGYVRECVGTCDDWWYYCNY